MAVDYSTGYQYQYQYQYQYLSLSISIIINIYHYQYQYLSRCHANIQLLLNMGAYKYTISHYSNTKHKSSILCAKRYEREHRIFRKKALILAIAIPQIIVIYHISPSSFISRFLMTLQRATALLVYIHTHLHMLWCLSKTGME